MEHIVQFAIAIDDDTIVKRVTDYAENQIKDDLMKRIESNIDHEIFEFKKYRWDDKDMKLGLQDWVKNLVSDILHEHQEEIVERAAEKLADKLSRTKAVKEAVAAKIAGEVEGKEGDVE